MISKISIKLSLFLFASTFLLTSCSVKKTATTANHESKNQSDIRVTSIDKFEKVFASKTVQLIDVRTAEEYQSGHIKNAINIDVNQEGFDAKINKLNKKKPVYVYCLSGKRSAKASEILKDVGFLEIIDLEGGIKAWKEADLPTSK